MNARKRIAADWIREIPGVEDFEVLPKSGVNAIKVSSDGFLVRGRQAAGHVPGKSLDFKMGLRRAHLLCDA